MVVCAYTYYLSKSNLMPKYNKRTQVLLSDEQYDRLMREARARGESMGSLIREAVDQVYGDDREKRLEAVRKIGQMNLPVSDWETMKKEIMTLHDWCPGELEEE